MMPNWEIGPAAHARLAQMYQAGLVVQTIAYKPPGWAVEVSTKRPTFEDNYRFKVFMGHGSTLGLAVADAWRKRKASK